MKQIVVKTHLFDYNHSRQFPKGDKDARSATKCGYVRNNVTPNIREVTCQLCLKLVKKESKNLTY